MNRLAQEKQCGSRLHQAISYCHKHPGTYRIGLTMVSINVISPASTTMPMMTE